VATATLDARDVDLLQARIQSRLEEVREVDATERWRDAGSLLTLPVALLTEDQVGEIWLRGLTTSPAAFLRRRFAVQASEAEQDRR